METYFDEESWCDNCGLLEKPYECIIEIDPEEEAELEMYNLCIDCYEKFYRKLEPKVKNDLLRTSAQCRVSYYYSKINELKDEIKRLKSEFKIGRGK